MPKQRNLIKMGGIVKFHMPIEGGGTHTNETQILINLSLKDPDFDLKCYEKTQILT